jgi:hypothetical protein
LVVSWGNLDPRVERYRVPYFAGSALLGATKGKQGFRVQEQD